MLTVLVIAGHAGIRSGLCGLFEDEGFVALEAADAACAKGTLGGADVDLLVIDFALSWDEIAQLVDHATSIAPELGVLYLVDALHAEDPGLPRALELPRAGVVRFPLEFEDVLARARAVLG